MLKGGIALRPREDEGVWGTVAGRRRGHLFVGVVGQQGAGPGEGKRRERERKEISQLPSATFPGIFLNILQAPYLLAGGKFSQR